MEAINGALKKVGLSTMDLAIVIYLLSAVLFFIIPIP